MKSSNIPEVKLGIIAVSRDCFPIALSEKRRAAISAACAAKGTDLYECKTTVENEHDMQKAVAEVTAAGCNALTVFLGNFGPETPETLIAKHFDGPCMFVAAAEGDGDMINGRGDAYCGMLNCSYNLGMRHLKGYIPEYPVGTAEEIADKIAEFVPIARTILGVRDLKIITFGPRPQDFFACNAPIKGLYELGVEIEENSELDLLVSYKEHAGDPRIADVCADMAAEMGEGHYYPDLLTRMAQFELTLLDWAENHKGSKKYVAPILEALDWIKGRTGTEAEHPNVLEIGDLFDFLEQQDQKYETALDALYQEKLEIKSRLDRLQNELMQVNREYESAQEDISRLSYSRTQEIDPADFQFFLDGISKFTPTEDKIFALYLDGKSAKEIIAILGITENTLKFHNKNIYNKLGVSSRKQLLRYATLMKKQEEDTRN